MPTIKVKDKGVWKSIGSAGGGLGAQPNWNQNDPTKEDYIKNRTHYIEDPKEVTVASGIAGGYPQREFSTPIELEGGKLYTVTVNDVEYELTAQYENNMDITYLGNPSYLGGPDNGSNTPFLIAFNTFYAPYGLYNISISALIDDVQTTLINETIEFYWDWDFDGILEAGHEYKVIFDGIEYNFTATENADGSAIIIGDMTQNPFDIQYTDDSLILYSLIPGIHTISMMDMTSESEIIEYQNISSLPPYYESFPLYEIKDGQTYSVQFGDNTYSCVAAKCDEDGLIYLGNPVYGVWHDLFEPDVQSTGEPFIYIYSAKFGGGRIVSDSGSIDNFSITTMESEIHALDPKFLPEGIGYIETVNSIILSEDRFDGFTVMQEPLYAISIPLEFKPVINGEYTVRWDGVDYTVPGVLVSGVFCLGNTNYADMLPGGDIPFAIISPPTSEGVYFVTESTAESHTVAISGPVKVAHKMDRNCLPEDVAFLDDIPYVPSRIVNSINGKSGHLTITEGVGKAGIGENAEVFNGINSRNAFGSYSHAEGNESYSFGEVSHAENHSIASGAFSHAEGYAANVYGFSFFGDGNSETYTVTDDGYLPRVDSVIWYNNVAARVIAVDYENRTFTVNNALLSPSVQNPIRVYSNIISLGALGDCSHSEGENTSAWGKCSHAEGDSSQSTGIASHAEGRSSNAAGDYSHAEGYSSTAADEASHAEGYSSYAKGYAAHAENQSWAIGNYSHSEGVNYPDARPRHFSYSVVDENDLTVFQIEPNSGAENYIEIGYYADFGWRDSIRKVIEFDKDSLIFTIEYPLDEYDYADTVNFYVTFHSSGIASGDYSHSEGIGTIAGSQSQHVQGRYNLIDSNDRYAHIVGNGDGLTNPERSNAHTLDWEGNAWFQGEVYVGGTSQDDADRLVKLSEINGSGGVTSWNNLTDKPFQYKTVYYEWDEDTEYETIVPVGAEGDNVIVSSYAKISDDVPSKDFLIGKYLEVTQRSSGETASLQITSNLIEEDEGAYQVALWLVFVTADSYDMGAANPLTRGVWCVHGAEDDPMALSALSIYDPAVQLDESVIPDTIARVAQIPKFSYGTEDLIAGESELATGTLYFVYE